MVDEWLLMATTVLQSGWDGEEKEKSRERKMGIVGEIRESAGTAAWARFEGSG